MKKIIFYNPSFETGGVEKNIISFFEHCKNLNYQPVLITTDKILYHNNRFNYETYPYNKLRLKSRLLKYLISFYYLIKQSLNNDCLIISFQNNIFAIISSIITKKKIIIRLNTSPEKYIKSTFYKFFFKFFYKYADLILVNDLDFKKNIKKFFNLESFIVHNFIEEKFIKNKSKEKLKDKFFVRKEYLNLVSIGRLTDQKDHITILKAIHHSKKKSKIKMIIIGSGYKKNFLKNYIKSNNLDKTIRLIDYKKNPYNYISSADCLILSSKYEGSPNILLEAAILKKLIISSNCQTGPKQIISNGKGGYLFEVGKYKKLSKIIDNLNLSKNEIKNKINFSYKSAKKYSKSNQRKELMFALNKIEKNEKS